MEIIKSGVKYLIVEDDITIEEYDFESEINFSKLVEYLLNQNLETKIIHNIQLDGLEESEKVLYSFIKELIDEYNSKVDEFEYFKNDITLIS